MLVLDRKSIIRAILFCFVVCVPLSWASFIGGSVYRTITIVLLAVFLLANNGRIVIPGRNFGLWVMWTAFIGLIAISTAWAEDKSAALTTNLGMVLIYIVAVMFAVYDKPEDKGTWLDLAWIIAGAVCAVLFLSGGREMISQYSSRTTFIILGTETDPNEFGGALLIPISLSVYYIFREENLFKKLLHLALVLLEVYVILLTGSRGAFFSVIIAGLVTVMVFFKATPKTVLLVLVLLIVLAVVMNYMVLPLIPTDILERLSIESIVEDGGTNRLSIWADSIENISEGSLGSLLFGVGDGGNVSINERGYARAMHNQLLQMVANYGLVGLAMYLWLLWKSFRAISKNNRHYLGAFWGMMAHSMTLTMLSYYKPLWLLLMMAFVRTKQEETT